MHPEHLDSFLDFSLQTSELEESEFSERRGVSELERTSEASRRILWGCAELVVNLDVGNYSA